MPERLETLDDLLAKILGYYWCECCQRITHAYRAEDGEYPCCNGCWHEYSYWTPENLEKYSELVAKYRTEKTA